MASLACAARDIPKASSSRDNLTVVAARSVPGTVTRSQALPTPPNSISPALPPHGLKAQLQRSKLEPIDSDLDLHEDNERGAAAAAAAAVGPHDGSSGGFDSAGAITSSLLARYHLPDILLNQGPLAIRHIMGCLAASVPGFAGIPPTKARRLVVAALEGRVGGIGGGAGGAAEGATGGAGEGGAEGEVQFEKVGWGRWHARLRREARPSPDSGSSDSSRTAAVPIVRNLGRADRARLDVSNSSGADSAFFSFDGRDVPILEGAADNMSFDGSASASCSEAPDDNDIVMRDDDDEEDVTDYEDWAAVGAAALRASSYPNDAAAAAAAEEAMDRKTSTSLLGPRVYTSSGLRSVSTGMIRSPQANLDYSALAANSNAQEREAVEALLRLGAV